MSGSPFSRNVRPRLESPEATEGETGEAETAVPASPPASPNSQEAAASATSPRTGDSWHVADWFNTDEVREAFRNEPLAGISSSENMPSTPPPAGGNTSAESSPSHPAAAVALPKQMPVQLLIPMPKQMPEQLHSYFSTEQSPKQSPKQPAAAVPPAKSSPMQPAAVVYSSTSTPSVALVPFCAHGRHRSIAVAAMLAASLTEDADEEMNQLD